MTERIDSPCRLCCEGICSAHREPPAWRVDAADWPAVISQGPGYYGLRLPQEYGTIVEYVGPRALNPMRQEPDEGTEVVGCTHTRVVGDASPCWECIRTNTAGPALGAER